MKAERYLITALTAVLLSLISSHALALTAEELTRRIDAGETLVIIDIRNNARYTRAHIPGAINIPAAVIPRKRLPDLGAVVVYGDGLDRDTPLAAQTALNAKPGIKAEILEGGILAWQAMGRSDSRPTGLYRNSVPIMTYAQLIAYAAKHADLILIDLQSPSKKRYNLGRQFAGVDILRPHTGAWQRHGARHLQSDTLIHQDRLSHQHLYVLIDDGNGSVAEAVGRRLRGMGIKRVAMLAGGKEAIHHAGQPRVQKKIFSGQAN